MLSIKKARKIIETKPTEPTAQTLARLVLSLENELEFPLKELYALDYKHFELALDILKEWRLDRYYAKKLRLIDASVHAQELEQSQGPDPRGTLTSDVIPPPR